MEPDGGAITDNSGVAFDSVWDNIQSLNTKPQLWATADSTPHVFTVNTPVGVPTAQQCGKGVHIDAHVTESSAGEADYVGCTNGSGTVGSAGCYPLTCTNPLKQDEAMFAFFFFDLASCIQNEGQPPVRFALAGPQPRRAPLPADARYDARIALERTVSTRRASWHDLLNALVWTSFPRAKLALHLRQHRMIAARLQDDLRLPGSRTKEQDAVAMLDEGGVAVLCPRGERAELASALKEKGADVSKRVERGEVSVVIFGHAIYEGLACEGGPEQVHAAAYVIEVDGTERTARERVAAADRGLGALLEREEALGRGELGTVVVGEILARATEGRR